MQLVEDFSEKLHRDSRFVASLFRRREFVENCEAKRGPRHRMSPPSMRGVTRSACADGRPVVVFWVPAA
jgi:hypothetical protein